jgi:Leucine-rich repeat (LRR) protein
MITFTVAIFLRLCSFRLTTVSGHSLAQLPNLHTLLLSHNQLASIHPRALAGLGVLSSLSLNQNKLRDLPHGLFANTSSLKAGDSGLHGRNQCVPPSKIYCTNCNCMVPAVV